MVVARVPSPPPPLRQRAKERDTEIDIYTSRHRTEVEVDIHEGSRDRGRPSRGRSPSHERPSPRPQRPPPHHHHHHHDEVVVRSDRNKLSVEIDEHHHHHGAPRRRARSAVPPATPRDGWEDEGDYITARIDERGRMGEARHGHTRDWTIVDVPPGTERVRMDGVGGGQAEVTWQRYNGVRRSRFLPDGGSSSGTAGALVPVVAASGADRERDRVSVQIFDKDREIDVEKVTDRRITLRPSAPPPTRRSEMWTEITKDLVVREAIEDFGYEYEETEWFFYVMQYLRYVSSCAFTPFSSLPLR